jgi:flagellar FliL protein
MATEAIESTEAAAASDAPAKGGGRMVLILAIVGVLAGLGAGFFGVGPILAKKKASTHAAAPKKEEKVEAAVNHAIENIVLNPAGSGGAHFLMVTATFELKDAAAEEFMKAHEAEIRDRLLALFGRRTVDELTEISARENLKKEVLDTISPLFAKGAVQKVFFPQFVIQ